MWPEYVTSRKIQEYSGEHDNAPVASVPGGERFWTDGQLLSSQ